MCIHYQGKAHIAGSLPSKSIAFLSRLHHLFSRRKRLHPCGRKSGKESAPPSKVNWTSPFLWSQIQCAAEAVGYPWSPAAIVRRLQQLDPQTFASLRPQRISQWRDHNYPDRLKWTDSHLKSIEAGNRPQGGGNHGSILVCFHLEHMAEQFLTNSFTEQSPRYHLCDHISAL